MQGKARRAQQYAPPSQLPPETLSIFTDGSADTHKRGQPPPPAGYGVSVVQRGEGPEHLDGEEIFTISGQIRIEQRNVTATTNNVAELTAFAAGLRWVKTCRLAAGRPICMRYDSKYAAHIASGAWRAKRHKALAQEARELWTAIRKKTRGQLWMRHVKGHSGHVWNDRADSLAEGGKGGISLYGAPEKAD